VLSVCITNCLSFFFFLNDPPPPETHPLPLRDALPLCPGAGPRADFSEPEWPIVRMLGVDPAARGAGIGRKLPQACIARARRDGAGLLALHTSPEMAAALDLYLKLGFRLAYRVPDRFGVPYGVYTLALD